MTKKELNFWKNKKVIVTGHTGFKGSWLSFLLSILGSRVIGISLKPEKKSLYNILELKKIIYKSYYCNILDLKKIKHIISKHKPDIVFHLAAEAIVIKSYNNPLNTFKVNILGTANILEVLKKNKVQSIVMVTTDKCYENTSKKKFFHENDKLGGNDPYSASKAASEILINSYKKSYFKNNFISTARAGNVIGGGDFNKFRIIPDYYKSLKYKKKLNIRNPKFIRPWQHVFDVINGYLMLAKKNFLNSKYSESWNFSPNSREGITVKKLVEELNKQNNDVVKINYFSKKKKLHEDKYIFLSSSKSKKRLGWNNILSFNQMVTMTNDWYLEYTNKKHNIFNFSKAQLTNFFKIK